VDQGNSDIQSQIAAMEKTNQYYNDYITYLNGEIKKSQANSLVLQEKISQAELQTAKQPASLPEAIPPPIVQPEPIIPQDREREDELELEREEEDD
jgi:hypothetical protein